MSWSVAGKQVTWSMMGVVTHRALLEQPRDPGMLGRMETSTRKERPMPAWRESISGRDPGVPVALTWSKCTSQDSLAQLSDEPTESNRNMERQ